MRGEGRTVDNLTFSHFKRLPTFFYLIEIKGCEGLTESNLQ